jgi:hypothetical protein
MAAAEDDIVEETKQALNQCDHKKLPYLKGRVAFNSYR